MAQFMVECKWTMGGFFVVDADSQRHAKRIVEDDDALYNIGNIEDEELIDGTFEVVASQLVDRNHSKRMFVMEFPSELDLPDAFLSKLENLPIEYVKTEMYHKFYYIGNMVITPPIANNVDATIIANCVKLITGLYSLYKNAW